MALTLVPAALVPAVRSVLAGQGVDPWSLSDDGSIDPQALLALAFNQMVIETAVTPEIVVDLAGPSDPATAALLNEYRPRVTLRGRAGEVSIAPYGLAAADPGTKWKTALGIGAGVVGTLVLVRFLR